MKGFIVTIALFLFSLPAFSQAVKGCFFADTTSSIWQPKGYSACKRGCIPLKVIVDDTCSNVYIATSPANPHPSYLWGDNGTTKYIETDTHTYYKPGTYTVVQLITPNSGTTTFDTLKNYFQALPIPQPVFTVSSCYNRIVKVAVTDTTYDFYTINFGDGSVDTVAKNSATTYTYADTVPKTKTITVTGYYNNACGCHVPASKSITLFGKPVPPDVGSLSVASQSTNGQITLNDFNPLIYASYLTQWKTGLTGNYTTTNTTTGVTGSINFSYTGNTLSDQYCARIITYDQCSDTLSSPPLCSTILNVTAQNNQNTITWGNNATGTFKSYTIIRNGDTLAVLTSPATSYIDPNVRCGVQYCYQVVYTMQATDNTGNNLTSVSAPVCTTAISTTVPPAVTGLTASVVNKNITLNWLAGSGVKNYLISKTVNGTSSGNATVTTNSYIDPAAIVPEEYCYAVSYSDSCGNTSPQSNTVCPSILNVTDNNGTITLNWTAYVCSNGSTPTYTINVLDNNGAIVTSYPVSSNQSFTLPTVDSTDKTLNYQVVVSCGTSSVYSNTYTIERSLKLYVPNAFTPNGDGNNDVFVPKGKYLKNYKMTIFNRWGEIVFYTDTYSGWDGTFKGDPALIDSYAYAITATDIWGGETTKRGTVTLLK